MGNPAKIVKYHQVMGNIQAVAYYRISKDTTGNMLGIERQRQAVHELAERGGYSIAAEFVDNDVSAYSRKPRPGYQRMMEHLTSATNTVVLAYSSDRLYRRNTDLEQIVDDLGGVRIVTASSGDVDLTTADGRMVARMLGAAAQREVEKTAERVRARARQRAMSGVSTTGSRPFGWAWENGTPGGRLVPHPAEADAVRRAYQWLLDGVNLSEIARRLTAEGFRGTKGGALMQARLSVILRTPRHGGLVSYQGQLIDAPSTEGALVDAAVWRRAQRILTDPARSPRRHGGGRPATTWLGGLMACYQCGTKVRASSNQRRGGDRYLTYDCMDHHVSWRRDKLEAQVQAQLLDYLNANLPALQAADARRVETLAAGSPAAKATLERLQRDRDELAAALAAGTLSVAAYTAAVEAVESQIGRVQADLDTPALTSGALGALLTATDVHELWDQADTPTRRQILATVADTIEVHPARTGQILVKWSA